MFSATGSQKVLSAQNYMSAFDALKKAVETPQSFSPIISIEPIDVGRYRLVALRTATNSAYKGTVHIRA